MRNRHKTIQSLQRLAERPGTPEEGATARRLLDRMLGSNQPKPRAFNAADFPLMTEVWYAYWCYRNVHAYVCRGREGLTKIHGGQTWMRLKFDHMKQARWVPVTSAERGCHISLSPFSEAETEWLHDPPLTEPDRGALWRETVRRAMDEEIPRVVPQFTEEFLTELHRRYGRKPPGK